MQTITDLAQQALRCAQANNWKEFTPAWNERNRLLQELVEQELSETAATGVKNLIEEFQQLDTESLELARHFEQQTAQDLIRVNRQSKGTAAYRES